MWVVLQVAQTLSVPLHFPAWWMTALTILAIIGIPIVATLAWAYELEDGQLVLYRSNVDAGDNALKLPRPRRPIAPWIVIGVSAMAGVTGLVWWHSLHNEHAEQTTRPLLAPALSIAVLPLANLSSAVGTAHLGDGLSEELASHLARIPGMRVASRTATYEFKDRNVGVRAIAAALGVRYVLEGSVRRERNRLRVAVQLVDASSGYQLWNEDYDRDWSDVLAIQEEIARHVAHALAVVLTPQSEEELQRGRRLASPEAYDRYLAGLATLRHAGDIGQVRATIGMFTDAIRLDPTLPQAHAGLCRAGLALYLRTRSTADFTDAEAACRDALALDPTLKESELALAELYVTSGRNEQAEAIGRDLVRQHPGDADVLRGLADALAEQKKFDEAERFLRAGTAVEPLYWKAHNSLGAFLLAQGRAADAADTFARAVEIAPANATALTNFGSALHMQVRLEEAARTFEKSLALAPSPAAYGNLGSAYYYLGRFDAAAEQYRSALSLAPHHYGFAVGLAEALWATPGRREESIAAYRHTVGLVEESLKVNSTNATAWALLAYCSGRIGSSRRATQAQLRAESLGSSDYYAQLYLALLEADRGNLDAAVEAATRTQALGYPRGLLEADPTLGALMHRVAEFAPEPHGERLTTRLRTASASS
jgi:TolB-like protein/Tfp pilus assembly protein PilF